MAALATYQTEYSPTAQLLTLRRYVDGVLTSASGAVTLGITRDSDSSVILATSTAATTASTGTYTYSTSALSLSASLAYTVAWAEAAVAVASDAIEAADTARSLLAYRRAVQRRLGRFQVVTTSAESASGTATRELICSELVDAEGSTNQYAGYFALLTDGVLAGSERMFGKTCFTAATGTLLTTRAYGGTVASGVTVELANKLPATAIDGAQGVNAAVNWALRRCWFRDRISFAPVENQRFYSLQPYLHWLDSDLRIGQLFTAAPDAYTNPEPRRGGAWLRLDGELPMLEIGLPFGSADTIFYLEVLRPGHTWIRSGSAWSESTVGLVADTDQALVDPDLLTEIALVHCYRQLMQDCEPGERLQWRAEMTEQAAHAVRLRDAMLQSFLDVKNAPKRAYPSLVW